MIYSMQVVKKLIERYDYGGAFEVLKEVGLEKSNGGVIIDACRYAVNFDFETARKKLNTLSEAMIKNEACTKLKKEFDALNEGQPDALMSELLENLKFQIVNEEYIDFLGRVYRFKEAIYKYMFIRSHMNNRPFSFHMKFVQKKEILRILRNQYRIFNGNLTYALNAYFKKHAKPDKNIDHVIDVMNTQKMNQLIELRHESLVGHGFKGVSMEEIQQIYGNPYSILDDFRECLESMNIKLDRYKYSKINDMILNFLEAEFEEKGGRKHD
ncbi:hypothetical protein [Fusibacter tunisiensis]|uniref:Uncharacterized protein n=1 Tax=Fusibacter tunisiensis TaxID=1008308 RepID=A0ABS2MS48_9FIRM|nr:hypothetical protein [Fusibacter tunisiensis]MBM7562182.1 hypothetical protein [Fusibacter tunisiensis]